MRGANANFMKNINKLVALRVVKDSRDLASDYQKVLAARDVLGPQKINTIE